MDRPDFPSNGLTVVSLFSGCGGSSLGYRLAGYRELLAVEWDKGAVTAFRRNFPGVPAYEGDVHSLADADALRLAGVAPGQLDMLDGSPPCQGFSTAGKRRFGDSRNRLFEDYVRLLGAFRPRAFVMENVSGLRKGKMRIVFAEMTLALKAAGYRVSCRELNAWWYGVPQDRRRLIWIGVREDLGIAPSHPSPTVRRPTTVAEALCLPSGSSYDSWRFLSGDGARDVDLPANTLRRSGPRLLISSCPPAFAGIADGMDRYGALWPLVPWGGNASDVLQGKGFNSCVKPHPDKPAPTLPKTQCGKGFATIMHPTEWRSLNIEEARILQGFPNWFAFPPDFALAWSLIGNSVAPPMAEAVGRHVASLLAPPARDDGANQPGAGHGMLADVGFPDSQREPSHV